MKKYSSEEDLQDLPTSEIELQILKGEEYLRSLKHTIGENCHLYHETAEMLKMLRQILKRRFNSKEIN